MRIAILTPQWSGTVGGPSKYAAALDRELRSLGHAVKVVTTDASAGAFALTGRGLLRQWRLFQALQNAKPDIIHVHGRFHFMPAAILFRAIHRHSRIVFTFHTQPPAGPFLPDVKADRPAYNRTSRIIASHLLRRADAVTAVSRSIIDNLNRLYSFEIKSSETVPSGGYLEIPDTCEAEKFRVSHTIGLYTPILVSIGVLSWDWKVAGHRLCIAAVASLMKEYPRLVLLIAGDGKFRGYLENYARSQGVEDHVIFLGNVSDPANVLAVADIYVHMALNEGCSLAVIEAMLAEKPIIAVRRGGTAEILEDGVSGRLIEPNAGILAETVAGLLGDTKQRATLSSAARVRALNYFTWPIVAKQYETLYKKLMGSR